ncbi:hypothetical protein [Kibdelosporangium aridum]|uniref:Uncharacterized protein n=1 Tax=Kibdelosporangium aridum TaxID=2030 RepID=A0A1W2FYW6_KIBAR|nr:hypothetical protein [Kibdelosporangium aridum]SMD26836.1 hypothetical protein SAMN05661093_10423 [Kibdelosporangium aridum]
MTASVIDDFDLDIRFGEPIVPQTSPMAGKTSDFESCETESHCGTCGSTCTTTTSRNC